MHDFRLFQIIGDLESTGYMVATTDICAGNVYVVHHRQCGLAVGGFWEEGDGWRYEPFRHSGLEGNHYSNEAQIIFANRTRLVY